MLSLRLLNVFDTASVHIERNHPVQCFDWTSGLRVTPEASGLIKY